MAFCTKCGQRLVEDAKFCAHCGALVSPISIENSDQRKVIYKGELHKCPNCGEVLKSFIANCPLCGYEIRDIKASSAIQEFTLKLEQIEAQKMPIEKERKSVMKMIFGRDLKKDEDSEYTVEDRFEEQKNKEKANLICNFSVPNTKEDIFEFLLLASSNINIKWGVDDIVSKAWITKLDQVYQKAEVSFMNDLDFERIKNLYEKKQAEIKKKRAEIKIAKLKEPLLLASPFLLSFVLMGFLWNATATISIIIVFLVLSVVGFVLYRRWINF